MPDIDHLARKDRNRKKRVRQFNVRFKYFQHCTTESHNNILYIKSVLFLVLIFSFLSLFICFFVNYSSLNVMNKMSISVFTEALVEDKVCWHVIVNVSFLPKRFRYNT